MPDASVKKTQSAVSKSTSQWISSGAVTLAVSWGLAGFPTVDDYLVWRDHQRQSEAVTTAVISIQRINLAVLDIIDAELHGTDLPQKTCVQMSEARRQFTASVNELEETTEALQSRNALEPDMSVALRRYIREARRMDRDFHVFDLVTEGCSRRYSP